jgi:hypothetical protein
VLKKRIPESKPEPRDPHGPKEDSNQAVRINLFRHLGIHENKSQPDKKKKVY